jgi:hypothetical protein
MKIRNYRCVTIYIIENRQGKGFLYFRCLWSQVIWVLKPKYLFK